MTMKKYLFILILPLLSFTETHKFYVSVTNINYAQNDGSFQITMRIFIDDLDDVLKERYSLNAQLNTENELSLAEEYIEKYLRTKFLVFLDGKKMTYDYLGKKYEDDVIICYMELSGINLKDYESLEVQNEILTDLFDEQKNLVHVKWKDEKKSFILIKSDAKGMLNL